MKKAGLLANPGSAVREAVAAGLHGLGFQIVYQVPGAWKVSQAERSLDVVVVHGLRGACGEAARHYAGQGVPVAMIDLPHLRSGEEQQLRVTPPRHDWLPTFDGPPPLDRLEALVVEPQTRTRVKNQSILLVGQVGGDSAHGMDGGAYRRWVARTLETLRSLSDSKVTWRPHPADRWVLDGVDGFSDPQEEDLAAALKRAWLVVTYNSTGGLEALVAGVPVVCEGPAVYSDLAFQMNQFGRVTPPEHEQVRDLLAAVAYTQWTFEEIAAGLPLDVALSGRTIPGRLEEPPAEPLPPPAATKAAPIEPAAAPPAAPPEGG